MATIRELFKSQNKDLYGLSGKIYIESRGLINPPRGAALLTSSPDAIADLIGNQIGGALGGSANRPSDTIFANKNPFSKPITLLAPTVALLRDSVKENGTYFVKQSPAPASIVANMKQGASSPVGAIVGNAANLINKFGSPNEFKKLKDKIKGISGRNTYGTELSQDANGKLINVNTTFTSHAPTYTQQPDGSYRQTSVTKRDSNWKNKTWDVVNSSILKVRAENVLSNIDDVEDSNVSYIKIHVLGDTNPTYFNATISGLQEQISPEWSSYKFVGSPFNVYTYGGVERTINFDFKLYATDNDSKNAMLSKLNYLTKLVYPYKELVTSTYAESKDASQIMVSPNFITLSVKSIYNNVFGIVDNLSFSIDDEAPWATFLDNNGKKQIIPTVISVNFSMKVIENQKSLGIEMGKTSVFNYNFRDADKSDWNKQIESQKEIKLD